MSFLFGSSPKAVQEPNVNTINSQQQQLLNFLSQFLQQTTTRGGELLTSGNPAFPYNQPFAAPVTGQQTSVIDELMRTLGLGSGNPGQSGNVVPPSLATPAGGGPFSASTNPSVEHAGLMAPGAAGATPTAALDPNAPGATSTLNTAQSALQQILAGQPQDYSQYFKDVVAQPLEDTFRTQTLPAITAALGRSAGGVNSSGQNTGASAAIGQAGTELGRQLAGAQTALSAQAITNAASNRVAGVQAAPGISGQYISNLIQGLASASLPQQTQQTQLTGQANQWAQALQALLSLFGTSGGLATSPTIQGGNAVALPGSPGLIGELISAAGNAVKVGV